MKPFTDEQIQNLKRYFEEGLTSGFIGFYLQDLEAFIRRLECAEQCANSLMVHEDTAPYEREKLAAWLKASGKEPN